MSNQDSWTDPNTPQPVPPKKRMSGCMLACLIVGGLGLVMLVTCCGATAWFGRGMFPKALKGPEDVAAVGRSILNLELPPDFNPAEGMSWKTMIFNLQIAEYRHKEGKGAMVIGMMKVEMGPPEQADLQTKQLRDPFEAKFKASLDIEKSESRELTIAGQKVPVTFEEGKDKNTKTPTHLVSGVIDLPSGRTFFMLRMDDDIWDEEAVVKMLEEAKAP